MKGSSFDEAHVTCWLQMKLLHEMLNVSPWRYYPLSLQILAPEFEKVQQKCLQLPAHMPTTVAPLEVHFLDFMLQIFTYRISGLSKVV